MNRLRIATRKSALALAQTELVAGWLRQKHPGLSVEIVPVSTQGDQNIDEPLWKMEGTGFFTTHLEGALLDNRADIAVHSFKDLPTTETAGLTIAAVPLRENPADCVVSRLRVGSMIRVAGGAFVGTSSLRRQAQLLEIRPDLNIKPIRGNVDTRLRKLDEGQYDMLVMAAAGLIRLGLRDRITFMLEPTEFLPAAAQGALAIQARADDIRTIELVRMIDDAVTRQLVDAERFVMKQLHPGCHAPVGVYASAMDGRITIYAFVSHIDGSEIVRREIEGEFDQSAELARTLASRMIDDGAKEILEAGK